MLLAWKKASKGKRCCPAAAAFEYQLAEQLLTLQNELLTEQYRPGRYTHFYIHEPKRRLISAAPFRDRVVHHALCNIIEPVFEHYFIADSYANRIGKGTHKAVDRLQYFARRYRYVLRLDIVKHFPAIDHQILYSCLTQYLHDQQLLRLVKIIIDSGAGILEQEVDSSCFPGDDPLDLQRPKGLPIGNLTSQFWSNCYLHPLDSFVKRELSCRAYLRYVDDSAVFADSKSQLWEWKYAIQDKLASLRLCFHQNTAQVIPVTQGIPWLGFVVYRQYRKLKSRKVVYASRNLNAQYALWKQGKISFAEFDSRIKGWVNYVSYADSWGLRKHILNALH